MDWLEATGIFLLGWFGKKLKRLAESVLDTIWFLVRCRPTLRCFFFMSLYAAFLEEVANLQDAGQLNESTLKTVRRFVSWADPKIQAWVQRVRPGKPVGSV